MLNFIKKIRELKQKRAELALKIYMELVQLEAIISTRPWLNPDKTDIENYNLAVNEQIEAMKKYKTEAIQLGMKKYKKLELPENFNYQPKPRTVYEGGIVKPKEGRIIHLNENKITKEQYKTVMNEINIAMEKQHP